jgi:hypothetical protein
MHMAALLKFEVDELLEVPPENREQTLARLRDLQKHATRAIRTATARWNLDEAPVVVPESDESGLFVQAGSRG